MKKKKVLIAALVVILIGAVGAVAFLALNGNNEDKTTTKSAASSTEVSSTSSTQAPKTSVPTTEAPGETTTKASEPEFIKSGVWYLVDEDKEECYAFEFNGDGSADVAYFNSDNIEGFDAQYSKGDAKYEINDNKLVISKLPSTMSIKSVEFDLEDGSIKYNGEKLRNFRNISLDNALECFE